MPFNSCLARSAAILLILLVSAPLAASARPQSASEQQLLDHLQDIDHEVSRVLRRARGRAEAGDSPAAEVAREAERMRRHLRRLEAEVQGWGSPRRQALLERLRALGPAVGRLEAAAAALRRDPGALAALPREVLAHGDAAKTAAANDDCADAAEIGAGMLSGDTSGAVNDGSASCGNSSFAPDVWYQYTSASSGEVYANTFGSAFDTVLSVHSSCPSPDSHEIECNDNQSGLQSAISFYAEEGVEYTIRVSGFAGASGAFNLDVGPGGAISGTLTDAASGQPIAMATVVVEAADGFGYFSAAVDADGSYTIAAIEPGSYHAYVADSSPYVAEVWDGVPCAGTCDPAAGMAISVATGSVTSGIDFALDRGGSIAGTVSDAATGEPIASAAITLWSEHYNYSLAYAFSDESGGYSVDGLAAGAYFVVVSSGEHTDELYDDHACPGGAGYGCQPRDGEAVQVALGTATTGIDFALDRFGAISGVITESAGGQPVAFVDVEIVDQSGFVVGGNFSANTGLYNVGGLPSGSYFARTRSFGDYADELYDDIPCGEPCDPTTAGAAIAVISGATTENIDFALDRRGAIAGTVREEAGGEPAGGARVTVWNAGGDFEGDVYVDPAGGYYIGELPAGNYFVTTESFDYDLSGHRYRDELYDDMPCFSGAPGGCDPTTGTPVAVSTGATTTGIDFALVEAGSISGAVTSEDAGEPLSEVSIIVYDQAGQQAAYAESVDGVYTAFGLTAGSYFVGAFSSPWVDELYDDEPCDDYAGCDPTIGTPVAVSLGTPTEGIDFALAPDGGIAGTVTRAEGGVLGEYRVELYGEDGYLRDLTTTGAAGEYRFSGLSAGSYFVRTGGFEYDSGGPRYRDEAYDDLPCATGCDPAAGMPVAVGVAGITTGIDFVLDLLGSISGSVSEVATGEPIEHALVTIYDATGIAVASDWSGSAGAFTAFGAPAGNVFAVATRSGYAPELYADMICGSTCNVTTGTPITVSLGAAVEGIDFTLDLPGSISGTVSNAATGNPVGNVEVEIWNQTGYLVTRTYTDPVGAYVAEQMVPDTYFVATRPEAFLGQLYQGLPCAPYDACDPTAGTPVPVSHGAVTAGIDFELTLGGVVSVQVTDAETGEELYADVTLWHENGEFARGWSGPGRYAFVGLNAGTYYISAGEYSFHHQLYDHIACPGGPPEGCDPTSGTPVIVTDNSYQHIDFALARSCFASDTVMCLNDNRFQVEVAWQDSDHNIGAGSGVPLTGASGYFWFFDDANVEMVVKVLDACGLPGFNNYWVFAGGLTNVEVILTVTDTESGEVQEYVNQLGDAFQPVQDTGSFSTCP